MSQAKVILPIGDFAEGLKRASKPTFRKHGLELPEDNVWIKIIHECILDVLELRCKAIENKVKMLPRILARVFPWYEEGDEFSDFWFEHAFDPIYFRILTCINAVVPNAGWDFWMTRSIGDALIIESAGDYRILDWQRRKERGDFDDTEDTLDSFEQIRCHWEEEFENEG